MIPHLPGLSMLERWALRILVRSRRTALVVVKPFGHREMMVAANPNDPAGHYVTQGKGEPLSMQLERIFHQPAYGEME